MCVYDSIYTYTAIQTDRKGNTMEQLTIGQGAEVIRQPLTKDTYNSFISYLDASPKTIETYTRDIRQFAAYLQRQGITQPSREDVIAFKEYLAETGHKATTIQNYVTAVKIFFSWTEQAGLYPNVAEHVKGAKISREHKKDYLTSSQVKDLFGSIERDTLKGKRDYAILTLAVTAGLRTIELQRANIEDIRTAGDNTVLYIQGKGRDEKAEYVKIPQQTEKAIRDYLNARGAEDPAEPLFTSTSHNNAGQRMTTRAISGLIKERLISAGYKSDRLTAHSMRHTAVTLALLGGETLQEAQQFARHANLATTQIYAHNINIAANTCSSTIANAIF